MSYVPVGLYDGVVMATTFVRYLTEVEMARILHPEWRKGQAYYNVLAQYEPGLSSAVLGTQLDPFQNDRALDVFLPWVEDRLADRMAA